MSSSCRWRVGVGLASCMLLVPSTCNFTCLPLIFSFPLLNRDLFLKGNATHFFASCFYESSSPKHQKVTLGSFWIFHKSAEIFASQGAPPVSTTPVANLPPVSTTPESELERKIYLYVNSTAQRCPNKIMKPFLITAFFHLPQVSTTQVVYLKLQIFERIRNGLWETDSWKNLKLKISWTCPFKLQIWSEKGELRSKKTFSFNFPGVKILLKYFSYKVVKIG